MSEKHDFFIYGYFKVGFTHLLVQLIIMWIYTEGGIALFPLALTHISGIVLFFLWIILNLFIVGYLLRYLIYFKLKIKPELLIFILIPIAGSAVGFLFSLLADKIHYISINRPFNLSEHASIAFEYSKWLLIALPVGELLAKLIFKKNFKVDRL